MNNSIKVILIGLGFVLLSSCEEKAKKIPTIVVKNTLDIERTFETVELTSEFLKVEDLDLVGIRNIETGQLMVTQTLDQDGDGQIDVLLFQVEIPAKSESRFEILKITEEEKPQAEAYCYSRFVPERTDDYAWENNRVAFRIYGPTAQKMMEDGVEGGTLSSGVDAWLKRVEYPIINKWYKKETETEGTYHEDTGEGLDNFHVGISRGVGGIAVKKDSVFYFSKNYIKWRAITTGPIRTSFSVDYADWNAGGDVIKESRVISLDYGSNLSKFEISLEGTDAIHSGLTLHEKDGKVTADEKEGWVSYWQPHVDSEIGTAIIAAPGYFVGYEKYDSEEKDLSNAYAHLKVTNNKTVYYAGFSWKKSGQFTTAQEWQSYLNSFHKKIKNPLEVRLVD